MGSGNETKYRLYSRGVSEWPMFSDSPYFAVLVVVTLVYGNDESMKIAG